ncbi:hypothetical protein ACEPAF_7737 [Sanghuangporus sanghuang]
MANRIERKVLWHPRHENKFIVGGGSQLSLFEWRQDVPEFRLVSSQADLQLMKCFAWSPDPSTDDLIAVGASTGKVELWRLESNKYARNNMVFSGPEFTLPTRSSRSVLALAFSSAKPNFLAVGMDKVKGDPSLVIWDLNNAAAASAKSSSARTSTASRPIVQQYAMAEVVSSLAFLPDSPNLLVAGISNLWLRLFDLRDHKSMHVAQAPAAKVNGIATDLFDKNRIACFGEGSVTVWDTRRLVSPFLTFSLKDAAADGARYSSNDSFTNVEFSPVRRGLLATLTRDAQNVRFWDIQQTPLSDTSRTSEETRMRSVSRDSTRTGKLSRLSWATSSTMLPWNAPPEQTLVNASDTPSNALSIVLSNTRRTKSFSRPIASFALVPSPYDHPLTTNIVVVSKEGDIEMHEMHDAPKHTIWSSRGDLALGAGTHFRIFPGYYDNGPPPEPWELMGNLEDGEHVDAKVLHDDGSRPQSRNGYDGRRTARQSRRDDNKSSLRASSLITTKKSVGRAFGPAAIRGYALDKSTSRGAEAEQSGSDSVAMPAKSVLDAANASRSIHNDNVSGARARNLYKSAPSIIETDISMVMRSRVLRGYGLFSPQNNVECVSSEIGIDSNLSELWSWLNHSKYLLAFGSSKIHGFDFSYQGILGIWNGLEVTASQEVVSILEGLDLASPSESSSSTLVGMGPISDAGPSLRSHFSSRRNRKAGDGFHGNYSAALNMLNSRSHLDKSMWKPTIHTDKTQQRRLALALCDWKIGEDEILRWEKEDKHSQAACWLLFTNQGARAIEVLMKSKNESHHMFSGTIAALLQSGTPSRNHELQVHYERLIEKLQDPHERIMLSYIVFNDWTDVLEEEQLPLRERLAIALRFLDDKELTSYLRRVAEDYKSKGRIEGLIVTGLTMLGLDLLQNYVDINGDVQTAALLSSYVSPGRLKDARAECWLDAYRDLLDEWKLYHHRCQLDIDRGKILQEGILHGDFAPMEWVKKQFLIRCNFCNKVVNTQQYQRPQEPIVIQRRRAAACPWCGRALPRCCVCLMSICIIPDTGRDSDHLHSSFRDTIDDAFVFCQKCRHGGHASHLMSWFFEDDGSQRHRTCPVADCDCYCDEDED